MDALPVALITLFVLVLVARKTGLPPIPLYIIAGLFMGVSGFNLLDGDAISAYLGHLGLIFLLFYAGLELKPDRILRQGSGIMVTGLIDLNVNLFLGFLAALVLGFSPLDAFVIGSAFFDTSSAVALASLIENRRLLTAESETIIWLMVLEDLFMVFLIFVVSAELGNPLILLVKIATVGAALIVLVMLLRKPFTFALQREDEVPFIFTFAVVVGASALALFLSIPEAVPLIVLGSVLSHTVPSILQKTVAPFRDIFLPVLFFFFGVTIRLSPQISLLAVGVISLVALVSKMLSGVLIGKALGYPSRSGWEIGNFIIARGEFAIVLAAVYGSATVSTTVAIVVIFTSIVGCFLSQYPDEVARTLALIHW
ncbi:MAG: cation:proton antiporter [Methanomicrobiales archaeon]|nr:cation:proton antiporter [Methanomicrobiales archaeon]